MCSSDLGSRPVAGPGPTSDGAIALLQDGRLVEWTERVKPREVEEGEVRAEDRLGARSGLAVRRRSEAGQHPFDCPWIGWQVTVEEDAYRIRPLDAPTAGYTVQRDGDWSFLAWEAPGPGQPGGRLWISDGAGVRAYLPPGSGHSLSLRTPPDPSDGK